MLLVVELISAVTLPTVMSLCIAIHFMYVYVCIYVHISTYIFLVFYIEYIP